MPNKFGNYRNRNAETLTLPLKYFQMIFFFLKQIHTLRWTNQLDIPEKLRGPETFVNACNINIQTY